MVVDGGEDHAVPPPAAPLWREEVKLTGARPEFFFAGPDWDDERPPCPPASRLRSGTAPVTSRRPHPAQALVRRVTLAPRGVAVLGSGGS
ncbi:hypothetical protein [Streptomyces sp. 147326]|uniref:hypothetical protein n=1 Tax=Streptomyces sp. 147326 TaxID=3074379 RepID=UPI0038576289